MGVGRGSRGRVSGHVKFWCPNCDAHLRPKTVFPGITIFRLFLPNDFAQECEIN